MTYKTNAFGQPIGEDVCRWSPRAWPGETSMSGRFCRLEKLDSSHCKGLWEAYSQDDGRMWTYMPVGPFDSFDSVKTWVDDIATSSDPLYFAILDIHSRQAIGMASYLRIKPDAGTIEVGHIAFSPALQKTSVATEAMYLMMRRVFDELGYRRYEWKCDVLNAKSKQAADRFGFKYDGLFKQALVYKGRNRDTAWFSIIDKDWPSIRQGYQTWLAEGNFTANGRQKKSLQACIFRTLSTPGSPL